MPLSKDRVFSLLSVLGWMVSACLFFSLLSVPLLDPDLWWHLASGREMVARNIFLRTDVFSHTMQGAPWINFEWLGQILFYLIQSHCGFFGLLLAKIFFSMLAVLLLALVVRRSGVRGASLMALIWLAVAVLRPRLTERIELFTFILFGLTVWILVWMRNWPTSRLKQAPFLFLFISILWCNLHGGFIYGLIFLALMTVGARWAQERVEYVAALDRSFVAAVCGSLVNPYGPTLINVIIEHAIQLRKDPALWEWQSTTVSAQPYFWVAFIICLVALAVGLLRKSKAVRFWAPAVVVFLLWGTRAERNAGLTAFILIPFLAASLAALPPSIARRVETLSLTFALLLMVLLAHGHVHSFPRHAVRIDRFPVGACDFVENNHVDGTMYNTYGAGGYIEWALGPTRKVFMDGRYLFYPLGVEERNLFQGTPEYASEQWQRHLAGYDVTYAITDYPAYVPDSFFASLSPLDVMFPRSRWALVYWDDVSLVFLKRIPAYQDLIQRFEYKALWPFNLDETRDFLATNKISAAKVRVELDRHDQENGSGNLSAAMRGLLPQ